MNIALIYPSMSRPTNEVLPKKLINFYFKEGLVTPPLGICYLGAILKNNGYKIKLIDMNKLENDSDDIFEILKKFEPDVIGVSILTHAFQDAISLIRNLKKKFPNCKIIVGGYHLSIYPKETMTYEEIDFGIIGDGEETIIELLKAIENNSDPHLVKGICFRKDGNYIQTEPRPPIKNLDMIPFPAFEELDLSKYTTFFSSKKKQIASIITSRGCPFSCRFCSEKFHSYRYRTVENIIKEIDILYNNFNVREICFEDSTFTANRNNTIKLCEELIKRKYDLVFNIRTRIDCVDEYLLRKLKEAGCTRIHYGLESGNNNILKLLGKKETVEQQKEIIQITKKIGIEIWAFFMIGIPGETIENIKETYQHAISLDLDFIQFNRFNAFPNTPIYLDHLNKGGKDIWREYVLGKSESYDVQHIDNPIPNSELDKILRKIYIRYYFRPRSIIRKLKKVSSLSILIKYIKAAWALI